jgi:hypothetical protein
MTMANLARRLTRVETRLTCADTRLPWAEVHDALARQQARARLTLCQRLGVDANDPRVAEARSLLAGDDAARRARDAELIARWRRQQGLTEDLAEIRPRVTKRLEAMARRLGSAPHTGMP